MKLSRRLLGRQSRFFTIIELLVVVSIISTIASIGMTNLNAARSKAADSHLKESLSSMRNQAQLYYTTNGTYGIQATSTGLSFCSNGVFSDPKIQQILTSAQSDSIGPVTCAASGDAYALSVPLKSDTSKSWAINSLGYSGAITGTIANASSTTDLVGGVGCAATGGCPFTTNGSPCISYSASSSPSTCDYVARTSTCVNGAWDSVPFSQPTCQPACVSTGGCPVTDEGGDCVSYSSATPTGSCASVSATSTCTNASWSPAPHANSTCTEGCAASGGCVASANGTVCTSYSTSSVASPLNCNSFVVTSTCANGSWSVAPASNGSCTVAMRSCTAPDSTVVVNGGTWLGFSTTTVACGSSCPAKNTSITCNDGTWSGAAYSTCNMIACLSCAASGGCSTTAHGGTCSTYSTSKVISPATCPSAITSTCSNGSWDITPLANASCGVDVSPTGGTVTTVGNYKFYTFTSSGTFTVPSPVNVDVLLVGGGGGGSGYSYGSGWSGGGGGGRVTEYTSQAVSAGAHTVIVGAGGIGTVYGQGASGTGGTSSFNSLTAVGGGGGSTSAGGTSGNGYAGWWQNGGGGGAGGIAGSAVGGPGALSSIATALYGTNTYYGGGGAGFAGGPYPTTAGGIGGGGSVTAGVGHVGTSNTGGGGSNGGSGSNGVDSSSPGWSGGSGVVIIRYKYQ